MKRKPEPVFKRFDQNPLVLADGLKELWEYFERVYQDEEQAAERA